MKRFIFLVLFLGITLSSYGQVAGTTIKGRDSNGNFPFIKTTPEGILQSTLVNSDGTSSATIDIILPAIALATRTITLLATNTVTLLKNIASFTDGDFLLFQGRGKFYWSVLSGTSASADDMQAGAFVAEAGDTPVFLRLKTSANVAFVADSAAPATLTYTLGREQ